MNESERKRGWWSRLVGENGPTAEEVVGQLEQELAMARGQHEAATGELAEARERLREKGAELARVRAELDQIRRAAEGQLSSLRAHLDFARKEHLEQRTAWEEKQRELSASQREAKLRIDTLERESARVRANGERATAELSRLRKQLAASDQQLADHRTRLATAEARTRELECALADSQELGARALRIFGGDVGMTLALTLAKRGTTDEEPS